MSLYSVILWLKICHGLNVIDSYCQRIFLFLQYVIIKFLFQKIVIKNFIDIPVHVQAFNCQLKRYTPVAKLSCLISGSLSERKIHPLIYWSCQICYEVCSQIVWIALDGILHTCNISRNDRAPEFQIHFITVQNPCKKGEI